MVVLKGLCKSLKDWAGFQKCGFSATEEFCNIMFNGKQIWIRFTAGVPIFQYSRIAYKVTGLSEAKGFNAFQLHFLTVVQLR